MDRSPFSGRGNHIRSGSRLGSVPANALGNINGHSVSTIVVRDSNGSMGKDCLRCDQTGHVRGNPADDTLPDLRCMADIFLPEEGALAVYLLRSLFRCIRAEAADPARRGFYTLTYRIPPYSSEQPRPILCRENNPMWRVLVPLLQFACYCWLALGVFALISSLVCGLAGIASLRRNQWLRSFHRYHARAIQELTKPLNLMQSRFGEAVRWASRDSTSMTQKPVVYPRHARFRPARTTIGGR
jgi:hypothetical protein